MISKYMFKLFIEMIKKIVVFNMILNLVKRQKYLK